jgi:hypothetical protein
MDVAIFQGLRYQEIDNPSLENLLALPKNQLLTEQKDKTQKKFFMVNSHSTNIKIIYMLAFMQG